MNKESRQFIAGLVGTVLFSSSLGLQLRTIINGNRDYAELRTLAIMATCVLLIYSARLLYKTI